MFSAGAQVLLSLLLALQLSGCSALSTAKVGLSNMATASGKVVSAATNAALPASDRETEENSDPGVRTHRLFLNSGDPDQVTFDRLSYTGGIEIKVDDKRFGGLSGLLVSDDGERFLAVSDKGYWVRGSLVSRNGELVGAADIEIKRLRGLDGKKIKKKSDGDAEGLTGDIDGMVYVSFEHDHRVLAYDLSTDEGLKATPTLVKTPKAINRLKSNSGLEGIALVGDTPGTLLLLAEDTRNAQGNLVGWVAGPDAAYGLSLRPMGPFKMTDLATLPNGDILTLERRFSVAGGAGYQMRLIDHTTLERGAVLDGPVVANAGAPLTVDNMEGLDIRTDARGHVVVYIISDDNYNPLQRTILLSFRLLD